MRCRSAQTLLAALLCAGAWLPVRAGPAAPAEEPAEEPPPAEDPFTDEGEQPFTEPEYILEKIKIVGNGKTAGSVIRRSLTLRVGKVFSEQAAELSRLKLLNLGYFTEVELSLAKGSEPGRVVLVVTVDERNTILIDAVDFGLNTETDNPRVFGGLKLTEHSFLGSGVLLSAALAADDEEQQAYEIEVFTPSVLGTRLAIGGSLHYGYGREQFRPLMLSAGDPDNPEDPDTSLNVRRIGGSLNLGWRWGSFTSMFLGYRFDALGATGHPKFFEQPEAKPYDIPRSAADFGIRKGNSFLSAITLAVFHDSRNDPFLPTSGGRADIAVELGTRLLGGDYDYSKFTLSYEHAFPTWLDHSIRADVFLGLTHGRTPYFNKFFRSDLDLSPPQRLLGLDFYRNNEFGDFAISAGAEYDIPLFSTDGPFYRFVAFAAFDATMTGSIAEYFPLKDPDAEERDPEETIDLPIDLTFDVGLKVDTYIGVFRLSVSYFTDKLRVVLHND